MSDTDSYHVAKDGNKTGPFSKQDVQNQISQGALGPDDLGWRDGMPSWKPLKELFPDAFGSSPSGPPPLQPSATPAAAGQTSEGLATASMIFGIFSLVICGFLAGIPAVIMGHIAHSRAKKNPAQFGGEGKALAGLITGYISIGLTVLMAPLIMAIAIPNFVKARATAPKNSCIANLKQIEFAVQQWAIEHKKIATDSYSLTDPEVLQYMWGSMLPTCPGGGQYRAAPTVYGAPTCTLSQHGHTL